MKLLIHFLIVVAPFVPYVREWVKSDPIHIMQYHALTALVFELDHRRRGSAKES